MFIVDALDFQYFALIVPSSLLLLALVLWMCGRALPSQRFLLWVAAGFMLLSLSLTTQILFPSQQLDLLAPLLTAGYMAGAFCQAYGMALRCGAVYPWRLAMGLSGMAVVASMYWSWVEHHWWWGPMVSSVAIATLYLFALPAVLRHPSLGRLLERLLKVAYFAFVVYASMRVALVASIVGRDGVAGLLIVESPYWAHLVVVAFFISMVFMLVALACAIQDLLHRILQERNIDPLTKVLNRRAFFEEATRSLSHKTSGPWSIIACDLDYFKEINDQWGHHVGDKVLAQVAASLVSQVRTNDLVARFGGEEFCILLNGTPLEEAYQVAQRIRADLAKQHFGLSERAITVTSSFGLASIHGLSDLEAGLRRADQFLFAAKRMGRDRICVDPAALLLQPAAVATTALP